ncbi:MAG: DUF928 domain-containing protein [Cyanobacteria bacterium P01_F01_bin.4]
MATLTCLALTQSAQAETAAPRSAIQFKVPPRPPTANGGRPARRVDLGSRSPCGDYTGYLTALLPSPDVTDQLLTLSDRPGVAVYVPFEANSIQAMTFELWRVDETGQFAYELTLPLTPTQQLPGVVHVSLPDTAPPIEVDHTYNWSLSVTCEDPALDPEPLAVMGTFQRIAASPQLEQTLAEAQTLPAVAAAYAETGIWYDALATLGSLYRAEPENTAVAADWASLLSVLEIDLSDLGIDFDEADISAQPPIDCCLPE